MKKILCLFLSAILVLSLCGCKSSQEDLSNLTPRQAQMRSICELAVMECYYHNVAKYFEEDAESILWMKKDKHFWIEYSGIVKLGLDISQVYMDIDGTDITITIPDAQVLSCKVDSESLTPDSYIIDKNSAKIEAADEIRAFESAQHALEQTASNDTLLLLQAQQRAQSLLADYVTNIGNAVGITYTIHWKYSGQDNVAATSVPATASQE